MSTLSAYMYIVSDRRYMHFLQEKISPALVTCTRILHKHYFSSDLFLPRPQGRYVIIKKNFAG